MLVLDSSGSMVTPDAGGQSRSDAAKEATNQFIDELAGTLDLGLVTYGGNTGETPEDYEAGCQDITVVRGPTNGRLSSLNKTLIASNRGAIRRLVNPCARLQQNCLKANLALSYWSLMALQRVLPLQCVRLLQN